MATTHAQQDLSPVELLVVQATLAAGGSPLDAVCQADAPALRRVTSALRSGMNLPDLARGLGDGVDDTPSSARTLVRVLAMAQVVGAQSGPAIDAVLQSVTASARLEGLVAARSAQAVMSARFLIGLPLVGGVGLAALSPGARAFLLSGIGVLVVTFALTLIGVALIWIRRLIRGVAAAGVTVDPILAVPKGRRDPAHLIAVVLAIVAAMAAGPVAGVVVGGVMLGLGTVVGRRAATADDTGPQTGERAVVPDGHDGASPSGLPTVEAIELFALALSSGVGLNEAARLTATLAPLPVRPAFDRIARLLDSGTAPEDAFPPELSEVARLIQISHRWGAPTVQGLRLFADDLRGRAAIAAEEAAEQLTVRLVFPTTLLLVPAFGLLVVTPSMASILSGLDLGL